MPWISDERLSRIECGLERIPHVEAKLENLRQLLLETVRSSHRQEQMERMIMSELTDAVAELGAKVDADTAVDSSAVTLLNGLTQLIKDLQTQVGQAADVPAALAAVKAFSATLEANNSSLAAAVVSNTPAAPTP